MSSLDGERAWRDITNRFDDATKADYFRLNKYKDQGLKHQDMMNTLIAIVS